jgi:hypothetical protein
VGSTQDVVDSNHDPRCVVARWITLRPDESVGTNLVRAFQCTKDPEVGRHLSVRCVAWVGFHASPRVTGNPSSANREIAAWCNGWGQARVGFVQDRELGVEHGHLPDFVTLLLPAGESLVHRTIQ